MGLKNEAKAEGPKSAVSQMATCFRLLQTILLVSICIYPVNDNCMGGEFLYSFLKLSIMKDVYSLSGYHQRQDSTMVTVSQLVS